jgi:tRNA (mo5U34)-methyltransferase
VSAEVPEDDARAFLERTGFVWHQRFDLLPGVPTPGASDIGWLLGITGLPLDLTGLSVLDIGTSNGGAAFLLERRNASRVVAVDVVPPDHFGFDQLRDFIGSKAEFVQASIYDLPQVLGEQFDVVVFLGVLYHLRHPLLALDCVRLLTRGVAAIETAVCDHEFPGVETAIARFYPRDELSGDSTNWFAPNHRALLDWCATSGFDVAHTQTWPAEAPTRALVRARPAVGRPEFVTLSGGGERVMAVAGPAREP